MTRGAGVVRSAHSLAEARLVLDETRQALPGAPATVGRGELENLLVLADALLGSALLRTESRGAHARSDHPGTEPSWRRRIVHAGLPGAAP
jgi:L-aspartate oxidase